MKRKWNVNARTDVFALNVDVKMVAFARLRNADAPSDVNVKKEPKASAKTNAYVAGIFIGLISCSTNRHLLSILD